MIKGIHSVICLPEVKQHPREFHMLYDRRLGVGVYATTSVVVAHLVSSSIYGCYCFYYTRSGVMIYIVDKVQGRDARTPPKYVSLGSITHYTVLYVRMLPNMDFHFCFCNIKFS